MPKDDKGKVKMTVIQFETESDNATLQENIRAITNTLARALAPQPRVIQAPPSLPNGNATNGVDNTKQPEQASLFDDDADAIDGEITPATTKPKTKSPSPRKAPTLNMIELDLNKGDKPLKTFMEEKKPDGDNKRYLAMAYWLRANLGISEVTMHHIYSCYRFMGWNVPKDAGQTLRNLKKQGWMNKGSESGSFSVNHVGENIINDMG